MQKISAAVATYYRRYWFILAKIKDDYTMR